MARQMVFKNASFSTFSCEETVKKLWITHIQPFWGLLAAALAVTLLWIGPSAALDCRATQQCRGDAASMCAASDMEIRVERAGGGKARLWFDGTGPYPARMADQGTHLRATLTNFGGAHHFDLWPDGRFVYLGNRARAFSGTCEGAL
jgi:hypothetical protein